MVKKDLLRKLPSGRPLLVTHYESAVYRFYRKTIKVHPKHYSRFEKGQERLKELEFDSLDYANTACKLLRNWCSMKKLEYPPINVFLGEWMFGRYSAVVHTSFVSVDKDDDEQSLLHDEMMVARLYISKLANREDVTFDDCVDEVKSLVGKKWMQLHKTNDKGTIDLQALVLLEEEFGAVGASSYEDIAKQLR